MKNLNYLLLIGAFCGLLSEQSVIGGQRLKCYSFEDIENEECEGDFCLASLYYVSPTEFYVTQQLCATAGFIFDGCDDEYPYTNYNVSVPNYFFPRAFHGCCDNGDYCNKNVSNLRLPLEYYRYTATSGVNGRDGQETSTTVEGLSSSSSTVEGLSSSSSTVEGLSSSSSTVAIEDLWMFSSDYPSSSMTAPTPSSSVMEHPTKSPPPPPLPPPTPTVTSVTTDSPLPEATDIISGPVGYALIGILSLMLLLCALVSFGFYCYLVTNAASNRRQTYIVNEMSVFYAKSGQISKDTSTPKKNIKIIVPHTEV